jgi:hypothetical protein
MRSNGQSYTLRTILIKTQNLVELFYSGRGIVHIEGVPLVYSGMCIETIRSIAHKQTSNSTTTCI